MHYGGGSFSRIGRQGRKEEPPSTCVFDALRRGCLAPLPTSGGPRPVPGRSRPGPARTGPARTAGWPGPDPRLLVSVGEVTAEPLLSRPTHPSLLPWSARLGRGRVRHRVGALPGRPKTWSIPRIAPRRVRRSAPCAASGPRRMRDTSAPRYRWAAAPQTACPGEAGADDAEQFQARRRASCPLGRRTRWRRK